MAPRGSGDGLNFEVNVDARNGNRQLDDIFSRIRKLGAESVLTGQKLDEMPDAGIKSLRQLATELERTDRLQQSMERSRAATAAQTARTRGAQASSAATVATAGSVAKNQVDLGAERVATEQVKQRNLLREQENKNLRTQSDLLLNASKIEDQRVATAARFAREQERANKEQLRAQQALQQNERSRAIQAERNARAIAGGSTTERTDSLRAERAGQPLGDESQLAATRYALYDVAQTATALGVAIVGVGASSVVMASKFESSFADVRRAAELTGAEAASVQQQLLEISNTSPVSFEDVTAIATLGAQMGIASGDLDKFSSTVSKFSATTDVTVDNAAQSFGRISNLLDVPSDEFDKLGSAIYQVGIESVATESEILSTTNQIAGAAAAYGFTADQVVGLSAAFASLGIAPEAARGSVVRIFGEIEKAAAEGGDAMSEYARILETDVASAQQLWMEDPSAFFEQLVQGLTKSETLINDLGSIGVKGVRDVNLMQRLVGNPQLLTDALQISKDAYADGDALAEGYAVTMDTLAAKFTIFLNNLKSIAAAAGAPLLGPLGVVLDILSKFMQLLTDAPVLLGFVTALSLLVGGFLLLKGAQAAAIAGLLALKFVMDQMNTSTGLTSISFRSLGVTLKTVAADAGITRAALFGVKGGTDVAATGADNTSRGMRAMGTAMKAIGAIGMAATLLQIGYSLTETYLKSQQAAAGLRDVQDATGEVSTDKLVEQAQKSLETITQFQDEFNGRAGMFDQLNAQVNSFFNQFIDAIPGVNNANAELEAVDARLASLVSSGNAEAAAETIKQMGLSSDEVAARFPAYIEAIEAGRDPLLQLGDAATEAGEEVDSMSDKLDGLFGNVDAGAAFADSIQTLFSGIYDGGNSFDYLSESGRTNLANLRAAMEDTIAYGETVGLSAADSVSALFEQLQAEGVNTDELIRSLGYDPVIFTADMDINPALSKVDQLNAAINSVVNAGVSSVNKIFNAAGAKPISNFGSTAPKVKKDTSALSSAMSNLKSNITGVAKAAPRASDKIKDTGKAAKEAKAEVVTLSDYVSDLKTVFDDASSYRFGFQDSLDGVADKWKDINDDIAKNREEQDKARQSVRDYTDEIRTLRAEIGELTAGLDQKQYFLDVAVRYGDSLRGNEIAADMDTDRAAIAEKNSEIAAKSGDLAKAQAEAQKAVDMSSLSFIEQRQSLSELYDGYQQIILEYARSGATQQQVAAKTNELRAEFERQAAQAGFSTAEINRYSQGFNDLTYAINNVPRNITVNADANPGRRALEEFLAQVRASRADPQIGGGNAGAAGAAAGNAYGSEFQRTVRQAIDQAVQVGYNSVNQIFAGTGMKPLGRAAGGFIPGVNAFPSGGFVPGTPPTDRSQDNKLAMLPNGRPIALQGGEPIINNKAREFYGDAMFDAINAMSFKPSLIAQQTIVASQSGGGEVIAHLSAADRALLRAALERPAVAQVEYVETARATAKGNQMLTFGG